MAQVQTHVQHQQALPSGSRAPLMSVPASSFLPVSSLGVPYNSSAPSALSMYGNAPSWSSSISSSPSIWSPNHMSSGQWPLAQVSSQTIAQQPSSGPSQQHAAPAPATAAAPMMGYYNNGGYAYSTRTAMPYHSITPNVAGPASHAGQAQPGLQESTQMYPQGGAVPVARAAAAPQVASMFSVAAPHIQMPSHMPQIVAPVSQQHISYYPVRAPIQTYQSITPPDAVTPAMEYDVSSMARFVVAVAMGILYGDYASPEDPIEFEQFVHSLLSATRLSKSTVLLSFVYLNQSNSIESEVVSQASSKARVVGSLVLANKMNDDNTFTNVSWGMVTSLFAADITRLELAWLDALSWKLNLDDSGRNEWHYWKRCWEQYECQTQTQLQRSPASRTGVWSTGGYYLQPFSVAAC